MTAAMDRTISFTRSATCRIVVGSGLEAQLREWLAPHARDGAIVLHDSAVTSIGDRIGGAIGARATLAIEGGESAKRLAHVGELASRLRDLGVTRRTALVAVGGGSITDLVGFLAAIYQRGVPCVVCPTTTLAMCDAALGGKNGVDHHGLKNLLGTIRQPDLLVADVDWLTSLPDAPFREGFVEAVKKAAMLSARDFERLEVLAPRLVARDGAAIQEAIELAVRLKLEVVASDELESDRRRVLNFGHTLGHALESASEERIPHGRAVAIGMLLECRVASVDPAIVARLAALLTALGVDAALPGEYADPNRLWHFATQDKKAGGGRVPLLVPAALGQAREVDLDKTSLERAVRA